VKRGELTGFFAIVGADWIYSPYTINEGVYRLLPDRSDYLGMTVTDVAHANPGMRSM